MIRQSLFRLVNWISRRFFASRLSYAHVESFLFHSSWRRLRNLLQVMLDVRLRRTVARGKPYVLILETTNICNLQCPFCLTGKGVSGGREKRHMSFEEAKAILDDVAGTAYFLQLYTWGEPLLNKETLKVIDYAKTLDLYVMLSTNGTAMNAAYCRQLVESGLDYLMIAIDGTSAETYAQYRRGGDHGKVMDNLRTLLAERLAQQRKRPFVEWQFIVFRHNEHEVEAAEASAYALGVDKFTPLPAYVEDEAWLPKDSRYRAEPFNPERLVNCDRPWTHLNVRADGGMAPCCYEFFKKDDFGNLREQPFAALWNNTLFQESRKLIGQFTRTGRMDESALICHGCLKSGMRPSFFEITDETPRVAGRRQIPIKAVPADTATADAGP
jgi:MoaA/NifB/PqqE/SkfB family radical SAM enzyme